MPVQGALCAPVSPGGLLLLQIPGTLPWPLLPGRLVTSRCLTSDHRASCSARLSSFQLGSSRLRRDAGHRGATRLRLHTGSHEVRKQKGPGERHGDPGEGRPQDIATQSCNRQMTLTSYPGSNRKQPIRQEEQEWAWDTAHPRVQKQRQQEAERTRRGPSCNKHQYQNSGSGATRPWSEAGVGTSPTR